jgi:predicted acylesterase/phospholipase RssA
MSENVAAQAVAGDGRWPSAPSYGRDPALQREFEQAVSRLWAIDSRFNPLTGHRELNADLVLEGGGVKGIGLAGAIVVLAEAGYRSSSAPARCATSSSGSAVPSPKRTSCYGLPAAQQNVVSAVRASMSIPFFFTPVQARAKKAAMKMPDGSQVTWPGGTVTWVDGGMLLNFPIDAFERVDGKPPRWPTIGIKLSVEPGTQPADKPVRRTVREGIRCLQTMTGEWDRYRVEQATAERIIFVPNAGISATQFNLSPEQQQALFRNGAEAATRFLIRCAQAGGVPRGGRLTTGTAIR